MSTMDITRDQAAAELDEVAARLRLNNRALLRVVARAHKAGMRQRAIEQHLDVSQATVHRLLRQSTENPQVLEPTPAEIIDQRTAGQITTEQMMKQLLNWTFTFGTTPRLMVSPPTHTSPAAGTTSNAPSTAASSPKTNSPG
ncbi:helix-turn-helix domain-containing protein [Rhodococcus rhodochrous]|uniref:helix-turn-helix domain-containing protein n=1 Tax=Rhodococcus rhodochrous TaxID=1829 RepID=UPI001D025B2A|nr:hypothetical protein [Rhodococcus rhodochrous]